MNISSIFHYFRISIGILFLLASMFLLNSCTSSWPGENPQSVIISSETKNLLSLSPEKKALLAKNRRKEIRLIRRGDYYLSNNNLDDALVQYLEALEKLPGDIVLEKKIGLTYFRMKDFSNAYLHFSRIPFSEIKDDTRKIFFHSLFFREEASDKMAEFLALSPDEWEKEYFTQVFNCHEKPSDCTVSIGAYTGSSISVHSLQDTILNAKKISPDPLYSDFALATAWYLAWEYLVASDMTRYILEKRSDYFEVKKLSGFSLSALGKYPESRKILASYIEQKPNDLDVLIKLGEIAGKEKDYIQANLYLNNAVNSGYKDKSVVERQLAYNYFALWDTSAMVKVLSYLLSETGALEKDFAVGISLAFSRGENARAYVWSIEWLKKFPQSEIIAPLYMSALRIIWRTADAKKFASTLSWAILESPIVSLELGIHRFDDGAYMDAKPYFEKVYALSSDADFWREAENYLVQIEEKLSPKSDEPPMPDQTEEKKWWWF